MGAKKEKNVYQLINVIILMNRVLIRDVNLLPSADDFAEAFARCQITSLIDFFLGYDQITLNEAFRDMIAFMTLIDLL